ncbi:MAG: hypothetical protein CVV14_04070 [Gammaproteobacteria bacterium HGW-Gammaproteobacteria-4]|jgi:hypothetical protein|nr:MAG: hypothetical protein CVV14_04070 [Gammaproteobacteria bacterium HGW-Gammaproteobacteria-4]
MRHHDGSLMQVGSSAAEPALRYRETTVGSAALEPTYNAKDALNKLSLRGAKRRGNPGILGESRRWIASLRSQ